MAEVDALMADADVEGPRAGATGGSPYLRLSRWYRTSLSNQSHFWNKFGERTVKGACGRIAFLNRLVIETAQPKRCPLCQSKTRIKF